MHILYVHRNFPAQFGHLAGRLVELGHQCTFVSEVPEGNDGGVRRLQYKVSDKDRDRIPPLIQPFDDYGRHCLAVYQALKSHPEVDPDLIVAHSGFGSTALLRELYDCPVINFFEYYYHRHDSDIDFRPEFPCTEMGFLRSRLRNAGILVDLENCDAAYSPTDWQRSRFPDKYQAKIETIFDGIDTDFWFRRPLAVGKPRWVWSRKLPAETKVITYVSRGFELMRGFDIFMKVAKRVCEMRSDVLFVCVGADEMHYGPDKRFTLGKSFREHVLAQDNYDLSRFIFTGRVSREELARILSVSDLHIYLTAPFILSWSCMNALACGCTLLGSSTPPVQEVIQHEQNGLLADFYDVDRFVELANKVLDEPQAFQPLGEAAVRMIEEKYSVDVCLPKMVDLYERTRTGYVKCGFPKRQQEPPVPSVLDASSSNGRAPNELPKIVSANGSAKVPDAKDTIRVLIAMPHAFGRDPTRPFHSLRGAAAQRIEALTACLKHLRQTFSGAQGEVSLVRTGVASTNTTLLHEIDLVVCTSGQRHLLKELDLPSAYYRHEPRNCEPMMLGFECHAVLRDNLGRYDFYCYLEDDLLIHDPWLFAKQKFFNLRAGDQCLLQPNRYEAQHNGEAQKTYIDGDLDERLVRRYQNLNDQPELALISLGVPIPCRRTLNPHAGCFFLNAEQMEYWSRQPHFLDKDCSFFGPLESAVTFGIMRTFNIYKPARNVANFLEIEHFGTSITGRLRERDRRQAAPQLAMA